MIDTVLEIQFFFLYLIVPFWATPDINAQFHRRFIKQILLSSLDLT